jgi:hypothetical protein
MDSGEAELSEEALSNQHWRDRRDRRNCQRIQIEAYEGVLYFSIWIF